MKPAKSLLSSMPWGGTSPTWLPCGKTASSACSGAAGSRQARKPHTISRRGRPPPLLVSSPRSIAVVLSRRRCSAFKDHWSIYHGLRDEKRSEEHTSELQSLMPISYSVLCL